ncbi:hypothetical protein [Moritella marina]|uniref:hypothetical protein n=1 Tax=Moritella marina TaxID=90736 RepID=UPI0037041C28
MKKIITALILTMTLVGCGSLPKADPEVVANFKQEPLPEGKDVGVYLIRPSLFAGGGRTFWVSVDDKDIGSLSNGNYIFLALDSKKNLTVNTHVNGMLWSPFEVPTPEAEQKYFYMKISAAESPDQKTQLVEPEVGITAVNSMDSNKLIDSEKEKIGRNPGFDNLAMNPSFVTQFMQVNSNDVKPDESHGLIYIMRPKNNDAASFWLDDSYAGDLIAKQFLKIKVPVGKHRIYKRDGDFYSLEINVEANTKYFVTVKRSLGWVTVNNIPTALNANKANVKTKIDKWISTFTEVQMTPEKDLTENQLRHIQRGVNFIKTWENDFEKAVTLFPNEFALKDSVEAL